MTRWSPSVATVITSPTSVQQMAIPTLITMRGVTFRARKRVLCGVRCSGISVARHQQNPDTRTGTRIIAARKRSSSNCTGLTWSRAMTGCQIAAQFSVRINDNSRSDAGWFLSQQFLKARSRPSLLFLQLKSFSSLISGINSASTVMPIIPPAMMTVAGVTIPAMLRPVISL